MSFKVLLHPRALKALRKLDAANKARVKVALGELSGDPYKVGKPLHPSQYWGIKQGDYRAVYEINKAKKEVIVVFIGHRKNVYDDFSKML